MGKVRNAVASKPLITLGIAWFVGVLCGAGFALLG